LTLFITTSTIIIHNSTVKASTILRTLLTNSLIWFDFIIKCILGTWFFWHTNFILIVYEDKCVFENIIFVTWCAIIRKTLARLAVYRTKLTGVIRISNQSWILITLFMAFILFLKFYFCISTLLTIYCTIFKRANFTYFIFIKILWFLDIILRIFINFY
jgi:hypothetical protein